MLAEPHCPECGSSSVIKSSAAHEQGISNYKGSSASIGISSSGNFAVRKGMHSENRVSEVAEMNAPPVHGVEQAMLLFLAAPVLMIIGIMVGGFIGLLTGGLLAVLFIPIGMLAFILKKPTAAQAAIDARYKKQWYCRKCGDLFEWVKPADV